MFQEQETVYVRLCIRGEIERSFLAVDSPDADRVLSVVTKALEAAEINWKDKLEGFGSDGANVMLGKNILSS